MPELPEVQTIVSELEKEIIGKKIAEVKILDKKVFQGDAHKVIGKKISDVSRRAKLILIKLDDFFLAIHLKLTGQLIYLPAKKEGFDKFKRAVLIFSDNSRLIFNDLRRFGWIKILSDEQVAKIKQDFGPEPLDKDFTLDKFKALLSKRLNAQIKPLLLDQKFVAGIGNLYSDEILFYAGIHPKRKAKELTSEEVRKLYEGIKRILKEALKYKGSSIDTYRRTTGEKGNFESHRKVYRRKGERCKNCGGLIDAIKFGNRTSYFCPVCQPLTKK